MQAAFNRKPRAAGCAVLVAACLQGKLLGCSSWCTGGRTLGEGMIFCGEFCTPPFQCAGWFWQRNPQSLRENFVRFFLLCQVKRRQAFWGVAPAAEGADVGKPADERMGAHL